MTDIKNGTYKINLYSQPGATLDYISTAQDSARVIVAFPTFKPDPSQQWIVTTAGDGYTIQNVTTQLYLAVDGQVMKEAKVITNANPSVWTLASKKMPDGTYAYLIIWPSTQLGVDIPGANIAPGTALWVWQANQYFTFNKVSTA